MATLSASVGAKATVGTVSVGKASIKNPQSKNSPPSSGLSAQDTAIQRAYDTGLKGGKLIERDYADLGDIALSAARNAFSQGQQDAKKPPPIPAPKPKAVTPVAVPKPKPLTASSTSASPTAVQVGLGTQPKAGTGPATTSPTKKVVTAPVPVPKPKPANVTNTSVANTIALAKPVKGAKATGNPAPVGFENITHNVSSLNRDLINKKGINPAPISLSKAASATKNAPTLTKSQERVRQNQEFGKAVDTMKALGATGTQVRSVTTNLSKGQVIDVVGRAINLSNRRVAPNTKASKSAARNRRGGRGRR